MHLTEILNDGRPDIPCTLDGGEDEEALDSIDEA